MLLPDALMEVMGKSVLSVGSGPEEMKEWQEQGFVVKRLDIEPRTNPDICASMTDMGEIGDFDVVYCCHALEHLYPHEVYQALKEFLRVLKVGGTAIILVPDLEDVRPTEELLKDYPGNDRISGLHLYYGDFQQIPEFPFMAHHSGFISATLLHALEGAGFANNRTCRMAHYNLLGLGMKGGNDAR